MADSETAAPAEATVLPEALSIVSCAEGFSVEWHDFGLNIEIRFRASDRIYCLVEDARGRIPTSSGFYLPIERATEALRVLAVRSEEND